MKIKTSLSWGIPAILVALVVYIYDRSEWDPKAHSVALPFNRSTNHTRVSRLEFLSAAGFEKLYFTAAANTLAKVNDPEANEAFKFVLDNSALGRFRPDYGVELIQEKLTNSTTFALVFATPADIPALKYINSGLADRVGCYLPKMKTMVVQVRYRQSPTWTALDIIHEGLHARRHLIDGVIIDETMDARSDEELRVHEIEQRMLRSLGGSVYSNVVVLEKQRITNLLASVGEKFGEVFCTQEGYDTNLDLAFGPPASTEEKVNRSGYVNADASLGLLNEMYAGDPVKLLKLRRYFMTSLEDVTTREYVEKHP